jgi:hypothetical protein
MKIYFTGLLTFSVIRKSYRHLVDLSNQFGWKYISEALYEMPVPPLYDLLKKLLTTFLDNISAKDLFC